MGLEMGAPSFPSKPNLRQNLSLDSRSQSSLIFLSIISSIRHPELDLTTALSYSRPGRKCGSRGSRGSRGPPVHVFHRFHVIHGFVLPYRANRNRGSRGLRGSRGYLSTSSTDSTWSTVSNLQIVNIFERLLEFFLLLVFGSHSLFHAKGAEPLRFLLMIVNNCNFYEFSKFLTFWAIHKGHPVKPG